jgi:hypothetical protein
VGCGSTSGVTPPIGHAVVGAGDPGYALRTLAHSSYSGSENQPDTLRKALPNHRYRLGDQATVTFSDALVVGSVTTVRKGNGVIWRGEDDFTVVGYDDPRADTRSVLVTMSVDRATGAIDESADAVTFRVIAPPEADPERFVEGLAGLHRIAVVLTEDPNAAESAAWRPIMDDRLIGVVEADGALSLPGLGRGATDFEGDLDTEAALVSAALEPPTTEQVAIP